MKFTTATLFVSAAYLASLVSATPIVSITSPLLNTKYKAGQEAIISWINPTVGIIPQIILAKGSSNALQPVMTIATNVNANDMKYVWRVPTDLEDGDQYAFELGNSPDLAFAGPFTIEGGVAGASTNASSAQPAAKNPVNPPAAANNAAGATPAAPSASSTGSQTTNHNASTSHTSAANKQMTGQAMVVFGLVAAAASQFF